MSCLRNARGLTIALLFALCGAARADSSWETIWPEGTPGVSIDIPADVGADWAPTKGQAKFGTIASYWREHPTYGKALFLLMKSSYKEVKQRDAAKIAAAHPEFACGLPPGKALKDIHVLGYDASMKNGWQSAECFYSETHASARDSHDMPTLPGRVQAWSEVYQKDRRYSLVVTIYDKTQEAAEKDWDAFWSWPFAQIVHSERLPVPTAHPDGIWQTIKPQRAPGLSIDIPADVDNTQAALEAYAPCPRELIKWCRNHGVDHSIADAQLVLMDKAIKAGKSQADFAYLYEVLKKGTD